MTNNQRSAEELSNLAQMFQARYEMASRAVPFTVDYGSLWDKRGWDKVVHNPLRCENVQVGEEIRWCEKSGVRHIVLKTEFGNLVVSQRFPNSKHLISLLAPENFLKETGIKDAGYLTDYELALIWGKHYNFQHMTNQLKNQRKLLESYSLPLRNPLPLILTGEQYKKWQDDQGLLAA